MTSIQKEIADIFNECMGFHEGIEVPDCHVGHSSMDYADKVLKIIEKRIDELLPVGEHQLITITKWRLKEILK